LLVRAVLAFRASPEGSRRRRGVRGRASGQKFLPRFFQKAGEVEGEEPSGREVEGRSPRGERSRARSPREINTSNKI